MMYSRWMQLVRPSIDLIVSVWQTLSSWERKKLQKSIHTYTSFQNELQVMSDVLYGESLHIVTMANSSTINNFLYQSGKGNTECLSIKTDVFSETD